MFKVGDKAILIKDIPFEKSYRDLQIGDVITVDSIYKTQTDSYLHKEKSLQKKDGECYNSKFFELFDENIELYNPDNGWLETEGE